MNESINSPGPITWKSIVLSLAKFNFRPLPVTEIGRDKAFPAVHVDINDPAADGF
jgi:hypothetical protein